MHQDAAAQGAQTILSLKNIYRLLTAADYPVFSNAVLPQRALRGLTLVKFWREILSPVLPAEMSKALFDLKDKRNRNLSNLMNRTAPAAFYGEYFKALSASLAPETLLTLTSSLMDALSAGYDENVLARRLDAFIARFREEDAFVTPAIAAFFERLSESAPQSEAEGEITPLFFRALTLSYLTLHALYGNRMGDIALQRLRTGAQAAPGALWRAYSHVTYGKKVPLVLTNRLCELCRPPLEQERFVGREAYMERLLSAMREGGKLLICGVGGIGKTEALRQAAARLSREGVYARLAYVQYAGSLSESIRQAFPGLNAATPEEYVNACQNLLEKPGAGRTLLLVDNMNQTVQEDALLERLRVFGCDVVMTSRLAAADDFIALPLDALNEPSACALFALHYRYPLSGQESEVAQLAARVQYHPLTLGLLGDLCRAKRWNVAELAQKLDQKGFEQISYTHNARSVKLADFFRALFDIGGLPAPSGQLLTLYAMFPYRAYPLELLLALSGDIVRERDALADQLALLADRGWLEAGARGYSMHPVIAEAFHAQAPAFGAYPRFWAEIKRNIDKDPYLTPVDWVLVPIAAQALLGFSAPDGAVLPLLTCAETLLIESNHYPTCEKLLALHEKLLATLSPTPEQTFEYYASHLTLNRLTYRYDALEEDIRRLLALDLTGISTLCAVRALSVALLALAEGNRTSLIPPLLEKLDQYTCEGVEYLEYCHAKGGYLTYLLGEHMQALELLNKGVDYVLAHQLDNTIYASMIYSCKAIACLQTGRFDEAEACFTRCFEINNIWFGEELSVRLLLDYNNIGAMYYYQDRMDLALENYERANKILRSVERGDSVMLATSMGNIANVYLRLGRFEEALASNQQAIAMDERLLGARSADLALRLRNHAKIHEGRGDIPAALACARRANDMQKALFGEQSPLFAESSCVIASLLNKQGMREEARQLLLPACEIMKASFGPADDKTISACALLEELSRA